MTTPRELIAAGDATLGIEFGSTRIKACLVGSDLATLATGSHEWQNEYVDGRWTYSVDSVWSGLQAAYADLVASVREQYGVDPQSFAGIGISAMMHGYVALDDRAELLVPFRTWRNSSTGEAAGALTEALGFNIPLRWSVAHLYQAVLDGEEHVDRLASLTTLGGLVHRALTGENVLGVGDASGMFPIDPATRDYDTAHLDRAQELLRHHAPSIHLAELLPAVLVAGADAGSLTPAGAALLDPSGTLQPGSPFCPPEGDAGTGMVATNSVAPRTGNVSVGTSIFAMVVLDSQLTSVHPELDVVTTPAGDAVAMVHCNNGASEIASWARVFGRFGEVAGTTLSADDVYAALLDEALAGDADAGGLLSYNYLSGEPVTGVEDGRPLLVRTPESRFTLGNLIRSELYAAFATLSIGMEALDDEDVRVERLLAHGGLFRTAGAAQQLLAAAVGVPVAVETTASEGGAWGIAVLAAYLRRAADTSLSDFLDDEVFASSDAVTVDPQPADVAGFAAYLDRYRAALPLQRAAAAATPITSKGTAS
ncbi:sugar (pentulose or hexulose) kinase [Frondihabitans sp. PhB188]|uniref:xylulokinase n=1 Tax=Frondihabitans sp. PhB188 TaxID=2485200 RepID=UPI000F4868B3|nr:FGGY-family carbohydrate kinase [Frondihabitans sp. PhB188]ROQ39526.1 sugar (pentulose or hexulose) kinase [Frondihabitans sp. PhB188]